MNSIFKQKIEELPRLYQELTHRPKSIIRETKIPKIPAIYIFYEEGKAVHVGRSNNLKSRVYSHGYNNHNAASFAFKRARKRGGYEKASYSTKDSRKELAKGALKGIFAEEVAKVKEMEIQYLEVKDPVTQYLLELYTTLEVGLGLEEFDTH